MSYARLWAAAMSLSWTWAVPASGAPCGRPDVDVTFPPNGATDVPRNAVFSAHYAAPALYLDEPVELVDQQGASVEVVTAYDEAESMLRATPLQPLDSGYYELIFPGLRGLGTGAGLGESVAFFVQNTRDEAPPRFAGLSGLKWDLSRERDPCADSLEDRFVFELELGEASDDTDAELLSVLVFQTKNPGAGSERDPVPVALRAMPERRELVVSRPANTAGETCFAAVLQDMLGRFSGGGEKEVCVTTKAPPFFEGCALAPAATSREVRRRLPWTAALGAVAFWLIRRGARATSKRPPTVR